MGGKGLNTMLVASQVVLSVVLPTVIFPLVYLCSKKEVMTVKGPEPAAPNGGMTPREGEGGEGETRREKEYTSPKWVTVLGYALTFVVLLANVYVFVQLGLGN
jgi:metal iron transporter